MLGFVAVVAPDQPILHSAEIEEAIWVEREDAAETIGRKGAGTLLLPPPGVIGRSPIEH